MKINSKLKTRAWVAFTGKTELKILRFLKPGFRHCLLILNDGTNWLTVDPRAPQTDIIIHTAPLNFDLPLWIEDLGYTVLKTPIYAPQSPAPWLSVGCVGTIKRVLGLHAPLIFTPHQLYRYLKKTHQNSPEHSKGSQTTFTKGDLSWEA